MQRLSPLDTSFLHLERDVQQLNVGSALIFERPAPTHDEVCREIEALLPAFPRYRQRVRSVPFDLGLPVWVDDPYFGLHEHVATDGCVPGHRRRAPPTRRPPDLRDRSTRIARCGTPGSSPGWRAGAGPLSTPTTTP